MHRLDAENLRSFDEILSGKASGGDPDEQVVALQVSKIDRRIRLSGIVVDRLGDQNPCVAVLTDGYGESIVCSTLLNAPLIDQQVGASAVGEWNGHSGDQEPATAQADCVTVGKAAFGYREGNTVWVAAPAPCGGRAFHSKLAIGYPSSGSDLDRMNQGFVVPKSGVRRTLLTGREGKEQRQYQAQDKSSPNNAHDAVEYVAGACYGNPSFGVPDEERRQPFG